MANKPVEIRSTSLVIRQIKTKAAKRYHYTTTIMAVVKMTDIKFWWVGQKLESQMVLAGMHNILENSLAVSYKVKQTFTIWSSNSTPRCLPQGNVNMSTQNLYRNVPGSFICNSPKLEATQMTFNSRMVKRTVVQDTIEYNLAIKRNKLLIHATIDNRMNL